MTTHRPKAEAFGRTVDRRSRCGLRGWPLGTGRRGVLDVVLDRLPGHTVAASVVTQRRTFP